MTYNLRHLLPVTRYIDIGKWLPGFVKGAKAMSAMYQSRHCIVFTICYILAEVTETNKLLDKKPGSCEKGVAWTEALALLRGVQNAGFRGLAHLGCRLRQWLWT